MSKLTTAEQDELLALTKGAASGELMPGQFVASASMKGKSDPDDVLKAVAGKLELAELFSKEQREFFNMNVPDGVTLKKLAPLGPILTLKLKFPEKELGRDLVAEAWIYPDNSRILELSTKCKPNETFQVSSEARSFLLRKGVDLEGGQKTRTNTALQYFSRHLG